jgi:NADH dehydrogenase
MKIVVTGAAGFLGSAVAARARAAGHEVLGFDRCPGPGIEPLDLLDAGDGFMERIAKHDALIHCAALITGPPEAVRRSIVEGTRALVEAPLRFVYISSMAVSEALPGVYGHAKREAENLVREKARDFVILRPSLIYGRNDRGWTERVSKKRILWGGGKARIQPVFVEDAAQAALSAATLPHVSGMAFDLGGPELLPQIEFLTMVQEALGGQARFIRLPLWPIRLAGKVINGRFAAVAAFQGNDHRVEIGPAREQLGFRPRPPSEGIPLAFP